MITMFANLSDSDKAFWGNVIGAFIGTLGAFLVAVFVLIADRRKQKNESEKRELRAYTERCLEAEVSLNNYIPDMLRNIRLLQKCAALNVPGHYMTTLPRSTRLDSANVGNFRNLDLTNEWLTLSLASKMTDQIIEDFTNSYITISELVLSILVRNEGAQQLNGELVNDYHKTLMRFAKDAENSALNITRSAIHMLAVIQLFGELPSDKRRRFKSLRQLDKFRLPKVHISTRTKKLTKEFLNLGLIDNL